VHVAIVAAGRRAHPRDDPSPATGNRQRAACSEGEDGELCGGPGIPASRRSPCVTTAKTLRQGVLT
jgi:hypothetical protein